MAESEEPKKISVAQKIPLRCADCNNDNPTVVTDYARGDTICADCGLILGDRIIDEHSEWRTFSEPSNGADPTRVAAASNPLLSSPALATMSVPQQGSDGKTKWQNKAQLSGSDRSLLNAFKEIGKMCDRISLPDIVKNKANELFKRIQDQKALRGRSSDAVIAASVYLACRMEKVPRTVKEICKLTKASKKEIGRCYKEMLKALETNISTISTGDFMVRFSSNLKLPNDTQKAAKYVAEEAVKNGFVAGKCPISVAAAALYMVSQLSSEKRTQKEIANVAGVSEVTIRNSYKDLYPHRASLMPNFFNPVESLDNLQHP